MDSKSQHEGSLSELEGETELPDQCQLKQIKRKIDLRICVVLGVIYTASLVDRVNLPVSVYFSKKKKKKKREKREKREKS